MSDGHIVGCGPHRDRPGPALRRNGRHAVIDIHCHLAIPAVDALMRPHQNPGAISINSFSSAASDEVNRKQFAQIGKKLASIDDHIADMDATGVDIQAISPSPGQYYYGPRPSSDSRPRDRSTTAWPKRWPAIRTGSSAWARSRCSRRNSRCRS